MLSICDWIDQNILILDVNRALKWHMLRNVIGEVMAYGECCVNEVMIREQRFVKSCSKWFITKKCIIFLSALDGEQPIIEQIGLRQYTDWQQREQMTVNTNDIGKRLGYTANLCVVSHFYTYSINITVAFWYTDSLQGCLLCYSPGLAKVSKGWNHIHTLHFDESLTCCSV